MSARAAAAVGIVGLLLLACGSSSQSEAGLGGFAGVAADAGTSAVPHGGTAGAGGTVVGSDGLGGSPVTAGSVGSAGSASSAGSAGNAGNDQGAAGGVVNGGDSGAGQSEAGAAGAALEQPATCAEVAPGAAATRVRYQSEHAPYGGNCASEQQSATCDNGVLGAWTGSYVFEQCTLLPPSDCDAIAHGASATRTRFQVESVAFGKVCVSEQQHALCDNGALGSWSGSYPFEACSVQSPIGCGNTAHGATAERVRYLSSSVPFGNACASEVQSAVCNNGSFGDWTGNYGFAACSVGPAASCDGSPHGTAQERIRYSATSVPYGEACPEQLQTRSCDNGIWTSWTSWTGSTSSTDGYVYESCAVDPPAACGGAGGPPHGSIESRLRYKDWNVVFGASCVSETQTRVCANGTWSDWSGSYESLSCSVQECATGTQQTRSCGLNNRGRQTRPCSGGTWRIAWDNCVDPDLCIDGTTGTPASCNAGAGWKALACVQGQWQPSGACGVCSGTLKDPCLENKSSSACFAAKYEGSSCGIWNGNSVPPSCHLQSNFSGPCSLLHSPTFCTPTFGCAWTEL